MTELVRIFSNPGGWVLDSLVRSHFITKACMSLDSIEDTCDLRMTIVAMKVDGKACGRSCLSAAK